MVDRDLVTGKLAELDERVARVRGCCPAAAEDLARDQDAFDLVSFNLMLAIQSCADIASHLIADERWTAAKSLAEGFERLRDRGVLSAATAAGMKSAVVVRNIVLHRQRVLDLEALVHVPDGRADGVELELVLPTQAGEHVGLDDVRERQERARGGRRTDHGGGAPLASQLREGATSYPRAQGGRRDAHELRGLAERIGRHILGPPAGVDVVRAHAASMASAAARVQSLRRRPGPTRTRRSSPARRR